MSDRPVHERAGTPYYPLLVDSVAWHSTRRERSRTRRLPAPCNIVGTWCAAAVRHRRFQRRRPNGPVLQGRIERSVSRVATPAGWPSPRRGASNLPSRHHARRRLSTPTGSTDYALSASWSGGTSRSAELRIGSSLGAAASWGHGDGLHEREPGTGDFNGDGRTDVSCQNRRWRLHRRPEYRIEPLVHGMGALRLRRVCIRSARWTSTATGGAIWSAWIPSPTAFTFTGRGRTASLRRPTASLDAYELCELDRVFGDFNADGKTDVACRTHIRVQFSKGNGFSEGGVDTAVWCAGARQALAADVDGDGASELICNNINTPADDIEILKWNGAALTGPVTWLGSWCDGKVTLGDFGGDGKVDLYCSATAAIGTAGTGGIKSDLLTSIANGIGGLTQVAYGVSTAYENIGNPPPKDVVTSVTTNDGRGNSATTTYTYSGGDYDHVERRFLGFRYVKQTLPCVTGESACPYVETWLKQDLASVGRPETSRTARRKWPHHWPRRHSSTTTNDDDRSRGRRSSANSGRTRTMALAWSVRAPVLSFGKRTLESYPAFPDGYDEYGNVKRRDFSGDYDVTGDETTVTWSYQPNTTAYIVNRVAEQKNHGSTLGNEVKKQAFWYDGQNSTELPPHQGISHEGPRLARCHRESLGHDVDDLRRVRKPDDDDRPHRALPISDGVRSDVSRVSRSRVTERSRRVGVHGVGSGVRPPDSTHGRGRPGLDDAVGCALPPDARRPAAGGLRDPFVPRLGQSRRSTNTRIESPSATPDDGTGNDFALEYFDGLGRTYRTVKKGPVAGTGHRGRHDVRRSRPGCSAHRALLLGRHSTNDHVHVRRARAREGDDLPGRQLRRAELRDLDHRCGGRTPASARDDDEVRRLRASDRQGATHQRADPADAFHVRCHGPSDRDGGPGREHLVLDVRFARPEHRTQRPGFGHVDVSSTTTQGG